MAVLQAVVKLTKAISQNLVYRLLTHFGAEGGVLVNPQTTLQVQATNISKNVMENFSDAKDKFIMIMFKP